jgi:hypothetical protein
MFSLRFRHFPWLAGAGVLLLAGIALAATVQRLDFAGLTHLSTHIVTGRIVSSTPAWTADGGAVVTLHELAVAGAWKGAVSGDSLTVRTPGGTIGDYTMELDGSPALSVGDTVLLFLERNDDGTFGVISLAQGSFRVGAAPDGSFLVTRDPAAAQLLVADTDGAGKVTPLRETLASVRTRVDAALTAERDGANTEPVVDAVPLNDVVEGGGK